MILGIVGVRRVGIVALENLLSVLLLFTFAFASLSSSFSIFLFTDSFNWFLKVDKKKQKFVVFGLEFRYFSKFLFKTSHFHLKSTNFALALHSSIFPIFVLKTTRV